MRLGAACKDSLADNGLASAVTDRFDVGTKSGAVFFVDIWGSFATVCRADYID